MDCVISLKIPGIKPLTIAASLLVLGACGSLGDTGAIKEATELAIDCNTDAALRQLDQAEASAGLGFYLAGLERVGILRDAGRTAEAKQALEAYLAKPAADSGSPEELESSIEEFIEELREKRNKRTGSPACP